MNDPSQATVESLLIKLGDISPGSRTFDLWVPHQFTLRGQPVPSDVAMVVILDKILSMGYLPDGFSDLEGSRVYKYKMMT